MQLVCHNLFHSAYTGIRDTYPDPNERIPFVDSPEFSTQHKYFGKPKNGFDLFHGTDKDAASGIVKNGFDDHFFSAEGFFGAGAYFADDPGLSFSYFSKDDPSARPNPCHLLVCSVALGNMDDQHWHTPLHKKLGRDFRPAKGVDSLKGRIYYNSYLRQSEYIVYRFGQCKATYLLRLDVNY